MKGPVRKVMAQLGLLRLTFLITAASAFMSLAVAWALLLVIDVPDARIHLQLAFLIPFFVSPVFSLLTALSLRDTRRARRAAHDLARCDDLTGLANRRAFFEADAMAKGRDSRVADSRALLFLDIDCFKSINDTCGHEGGDTVIVHLAQLLREYVGASDLLARLGGEEFVIALVGVTPAAVEALAERILTRVRVARVPFRSRDICYTVSIGIALSPTAIPIARLLSEADAQLYLAKHGGRDRFRMSHSAARSSVSPPSRLGLPEPV